ncbi:MAG: hypothetical protein OJF50_006304 [Nitrospira sp.]|nr:hypothetical protein [Nitrospira sp.]
MRKCDGAEKQRECPRRTYAVKEHKAPSHQKNQQAQTVVSFDSEGDSQ